MNKEITKQELNRKNEFIIKYMLSHLTNDNTGGRTKLMKLIFLVEHYDPVEKSVKVMPRVGNDFIIYNYGVFSFSVYDSLIRLIKSGEITEDHFKLSVNENIKKGSNTVDNKLISCIDNILNEFGDMDKKGLETFTLKLLKISPDKKTDFMGVPVREVIINCE
jgi:hypothetical protein